MRRNPVTGRLRDKKAEHQKLRYVEFDMRPPRCTEFASVSIVNGSSNNNRFGADNGWDRQGHYYNVRSGERSVDGGRNLELSPKESFGGLAP